MKIYQKDPAEKKLRSSSDTNKLILFLGKIGSWNCYVCRLVYDSSLGFDTYEGIQRREINLCCVSLFILIVQVKIKKFL